MANFEDQWEEIEVDLPNEDVQEIIGIIPSSITRWGITLIASIFLFALIGSYFFKYPDIVVANAELVTHNPPSEVIAKRNGTIEYIFATDHQQVNQNDILAYLDTPVDFNDIKYLKQKLENYNIDEIIQIDLKNDLNIGSISQPYNSLLKLIEEYKTFRSQNYHISKIEIAERKLEIQKSILVKLKKKEELIKTSIKLDSKNFARDSILESKDFGSSSKLDQSNSILISNKSNYEDLKISIDATSLQIKLIEEDVINLRNEFAQKGVFYSSSLVESINSIKTQIKAWEDLNVLKAPISGEVLFTSIWSKKQHVNQNTKVFTIIPSEKGEVVARLKMPVQGSGRVKKGQKVIIKLLDFPFRKHGSITGEIINISKITEKSVAENIGPYYLVEVVLPKGMQTNYAKELKFSQNMKATAEIITEDNRLIEKLYLPIKDIVKTNL